MSDEKKLLPEQLRVGVESWLNHGALYTPTSLDLAAPIRNVPEMPPSILRRCDVCDAEPTWKHGLTRATSRPWRCDISRRLLKRRPLRLLPVRPILTHDLVYAAHPTREVGGRGAAGGNRRDCPDQTWAATSA